MRSLALVALMAAAVPAAATVQLVNPVYNPPRPSRYTQHSLGSGTYGVELRGGNGTLNGDWEIGVGQRTSVNQAGAFTAAQHNWGCVTTAANPQAGCGTTVPFLLTWSSTALSITLGSGPNAVTVLSPTGGNLAGLPGNANTLRIWAKRDATVTITDVDGTAFNVSGTGIASGAATALNDFYFRTRDWWGDHALIARGSLRIAGGRGSANEVFFVVGNSVVPEPATWAMMIGGFGLVGSAMRRRRAMAA